nr:unnamed protein product [Rangifer tarandus platyrhynchus]CAI9689551.1 unnamed protein product [Rangifer tarandus platyrhynchus]
MKLVTQMALKGTRASQAWEKQVQPRLEPQSWRRYLTLQDLAKTPYRAWTDRPCLGQVDKPCQGRVATPSHDQVDMWCQGLGRAWHMSAKVYAVVMVAAMALATQLALVTPSVLQSLAAPETQVIPGAPALQESHVAQPVTFCRSWGRSTHQGVEETLHPEPEF